MTISYDVNAEIVGAGSFTCGATFNVEVTVTPTIKTTTVGDQTFPESTVTVFSTTGFPSSGTISVYGGGVVQIAGYTGTTSNTFTGCTFFGGTAGIPSGSTVYQNPTLVSAQSNNPQTLPISVITTFGITGFPNSGSLIVYTSAGPQVVTYTNISGSQFQGCVGGTGTLNTFGTIIQNPVPLGNAFAQNLITVPNVSAGPAVLMDTSDGYSVGTMSVGPLYTGEYVFQIAAFSNPSPLSIEYGTVNLPPITIAANYNTVTTITGFSNSYTTIPTAPVVFVGTAGNFTCTNDTAINGTNSLPIIDVSINVANATLGGPIPTGVVSLYTEGMRIQGNGNGGPRQLDVSGNAIIGMEALPVGTYRLQAVYNPATGVAPNTNCFAPSASVMGAAPWGIMHTVEPQWNVMTISPGYTNNVVHGQPFTMTVNLYRNGSACNLSGFFDFEGNWGGISPFTGGAMTVTACNVGFSFPYPSALHVVAITDPGSPGGGPDPITLSIEVASWPDSVQSQYGYADVLYQGGCWSRFLNGEAFCGVVAVPVLSIGSANTGLSPQV